MSETVVVACKIRNGLNIEGIVVAGYYQYPGEPAPPNSAFGYGLTEFPKEAWERWFARNKDSDMVKGNHILAADSVEAVKTLIVQRGNFKPRVFGQALYTGSR